MKRTYRWLALSMIVAAILLVIAVAHMPVADGNPNPAGTPPIPIATQNPKCVFQQEKCARYLGDVQSDTVACEDNWISLEIANRKCVSIRDRHGQPQKLTPMPLWLRLYLTPVSA